MSVDILTTSTTSTTSLDNLDNLDDTLDRLSRHSAELVSNDVVQYENTYRLCYIRGPEGILIGLAQSISQ